MIGEFDAPETREDPLVSVFGEREGAIEEERRKRGFLHIAIYSRSRIGTVF